MKYAPITRGLFPSKDRLKARAGFVSPTHPHMQRRYLSSLPVIALAFLASGCISTQATMLDPTSRPPVPQEEVRVYRAAESIECDYTEVAVLHAQGGSYLTNEHMMIKAAKKRAGKVGANGVVLGTINEPSSGAKVAGAIFGVGTERRGEMLAVYVDPCQSEGANNAQISTVDDGTDEPEMEPGTPSPD